MAESQLFRFGKIPFDAAGSMLRWSGIQLEPFASQLLKPPDIRTLRQRRPVTEATIGRQLVVIASGLQLDTEYRRPMLVIGHVKIAQSVLDAEGSPRVPDEVVQEVIDIAVAAGTDPIRLAPEHLSPPTAEQASAIIEDFDTYAR